MNDSSKALSIIAFYLSEYDMDAVNALGYKNRTVAFEEISSIYCRKSNYLKLRRDEFDALPFSSSHRNGWKNREPAKEVLELGRLLKEFSFEQLTQIVKLLIETQKGADNVLIADQDAAPDLKISDFVKAVGDNALRHGFRDVLTKPADYLVLIHSEVSEVIEEFRNGHEATEVYYRESDGKPEGVPMELADVVIRCFDMADAYGIDLESAIIEKHKFNLSRPYRNGKRF